MVLLGGTEQGSLLLYLLLRFARDFDTIKWVAEGDLKQG